MSKLIRKALLRSLDLGSWPRRVGHQPVGETSDSFEQHTVNGYSEMVNRIESLPESHIYYSVYSFPYGHTTDGHAPLVDTLFLDFDIADESLYNLTGKYEHWLSAMDDVLDVTSDIASHLVTAGVAEYYRAVLSGHKGVHLYLDFQPVSPDYRLETLRAAISEFGDDLADAFESVTVNSVSSYLDVTSQDMARLARVPNTVHPDAPCKNNKNDGRKYCVPVTLEELIGLDAKEYNRMTESPRLPEQWGRVEHPSIDERINSTAFGHELTGESEYDSHSSTMNGARVVTYQKQHGLVTPEARFVYDPDPPYGVKPHGDSLPDGFPNEYSDTLFESLDDVWKITANRPCVRGYYERDDCFDYGQESHMAELYMMTHLVDLGVPYDLIIRFFENNDDFSFVKTAYRLDEVIGRDYQPMTCERLFSYSGGEASPFCEKNSCSIYQQIEDA